MYNHKTCNKGKYNKLTNKIHKPPHLCRQKTSAGPAEKESAGEAAPGGWTPPLWGLRGLAAPIVRAWTALPPPCVRVLPTASRRAPAPGPLRGPSAGRPTPFQTVSSFAFRLKWGWSSGFAYRRGLRDRHLLLGELHALALPWGKPIPHCKASLRAERAPGGLARLVTAGAVTRSR